MHVFVTGATGYIGRAVSTTLLDRGHRVSGLARTEEAAASLAERGIGSIVGDLNNIESWASACAGFDAVAHLAFQWKADIADSIDAERHVAGVMLRSLAGSEKPFVFASGTAVLGDTGTSVFDEETLISSHPLDGRLKTEQLVLSAEGVAGIVIRPPNVYGHGDGQAFFTALRGAGSQIKAVPFAEGSGDRLWSAVHVDDLAELYALAIEEAPAHQLFHAGAQSGLRTSAIARAMSIGDGWDGRTSEMPLAALRHLFPFEALADYWSHNGQSSRAKAERLLGWQPRHLDLLGYFADPMLTS